MEERVELDVEPGDLPRLRASADLGDADRASAQELRGEVAERADDDRLDQRDLAHEVGLALRDLLRLRVAVSGRPALEHVRDEGVAAVEADLAEQRVEQLAGLADDRLALQVLVRRRGT